MSDLDIDLSSNNGSSDSNSNASIANSSTTVTTKSNTAVIAGSTIGAVALLSLLIFLILYWIRKRKLQKGYLSHLDLEEDEKDLRSGGMGGSGGGNGGSGGSGGSGIVGQAASMRARGAGTGENMELDDVSSNTQGQQVKRLSRLHPPFAFAEKGRPLPHAGTISARSSNEHGVAPRNNAQTTVVNSVIMSDDSSAFEESEFASSIVPLSPSSAPPNTESLHPAVAQAAEGSVVLAPNVVVVPGDGSRGSIKAAYKSNGTGDWPLSPTSSASNQTQLQPRPSYVTRQGQGITGGEDILRIGREVDSGIRLDPMQFNLTAPDLLPPSYSATTYRP